MNSRLLAVLLLPALLVALRAAGFWVVGLDAGGAPLSGTAAKAFLLDSAALRSSRDALVASLNVLKLGVPRVAVEVEAVIGFVMARLGHQYDLKNVIDLARYLIPTPPVPVRWRRRLLALGSGDPTRAICSTLIAMAFQSIRYPILPMVESVPSGDPQYPGCVDEILHVRHHSLFVPRDFDVSPYFAVVKPTLVEGFNHRNLTWHDPVSSVAKAMTNTVPRLQEAA